MDRGGRGDALGIPVAISHPVVSEGPHIGTDGTFSVVSEMLKQIIFPQDGSLWGKLIAQEGKTERGMKQQRNCSVMTLCPLTHCSGREQSGR